MSYREEHGQVILTMSREDYHQLTMAVFNSATRNWALFALLDRLNQGNTHYTPYQVEGEKDSRNGLPYEPDVD